MNEQTATYRPRASYPLFAPHISSDGYRYGEIEVSDVQEADEGTMTFAELIRSIVLSIKKYLKGKRDDR